MPTAIVFDPLSPENISNPYSLYARLREAAPVYWDEPLKSWLLTRHQDCVAVLRDTQHFAADPRRAGEPVPDAALTIQMLDPPEHDAVSSRLSIACRAQDLPAVRQRARRHADELLARLVENGGGEFMTDFAMPFSLAAICDFLGVEAPDVATLVPICNAFMQNMDAGLRPERAGPAARAQADLIALVDTWFHPAPQTGVLGVRLVQHSAGEISRAELMNNLYVMFNAGYQSAFSAIGNAVLALLRCERNLAQLLDPETLDLAVEELFRYDATAQAMSRICVEDVALGGTRISRGQMVVLLLGAANRDPEQFTRPNDLILNRTPNRHMAFGWGNHFCIGSLLAREMMTITLSSLRDNTPQIRLAGEPVHKPQATLRCLDHIPVSFAM
ncbi:MAG: cytochrome P450 [Pseudomonadota bacterium]|nr:cytochrome P450 [Pseudomonadota bacterium]